MGRIALVVVIAAVALLVFVLVALLRKVPHGSSGVALQMEKLPSADRAVVTPLIQSEWKRMSSALVVGFAAAVIVWQLGGIWASLYGLPYALAGMVGAVVGLCVMNAWPPTSWPSDERKARVAEIAPRGATSFGKQWIFVLPLGAAVALVLGLILTGLYSSTDENGLHRVFSRRRLAGWGVENGQVVDVQYTISASSPFPGWYYGVPLIVGTILFIAVVYWNLRRAALAPRPTDINLFAIDASLRTLRTRFTMAASSAALGLYIAGVGVMTGITLRSAHLEPVPTAELDVIPRYAAVEPGHTFAVVLTVASLAIAVAAMTLLFRAVAAVLEAVSAARVESARVRDEAH